MKRSKKILNICVSLVMALGIVTGMGTSAKAAFYSNVTRTVNGYSLVGINVLRETLHDDGYSTTSSGSVTDVWLTTDTCWFPNNVVNEKTWKAAYPTGEYAKGSFNNVIGIPSPWAVVGLSSSTVYMSILF